MSNTVRQQIVSFLATQLATITTANGYQTNVGNSVNVCRPVKPTDSEAVNGTLNLWDIDDDVVAQLSGIHKHSLSIEIYVTKTGSGAAIWLRQVIADLARLVGLNRKWNALAIDTKPGKNEYELDQDKKITGTVKYPFTIEFYTLAWDEFTQP